MKNVSQTNPMRPDTIQIYVELAPIFFLKNNMKAEIYDVKIEFCSILCHKNWICMSLKRPFLITAIQITFYFTKLQNDARQLH